MSDEIKIKIRLDDGSVKDGFLAVEKQADDSAKKIKNSFDKNKSGGLDSLAQGANKFETAINAAEGGVENLAKTALNAIGPIGQIALGIGAAAFAATKLALEGEKVNAVNAQFARLAESNGLAVDSFKESLIGATRGLIDDEDALQIATKGIVALGDEAKKLPQIMDVARNASRALGKDFKGAFEDLSQFVETGNVRVLRQYGIILDLDKAYTKAAKSIGLTAAELTEQQKQTIRANELLDKVPKKFGDATDSVTPLKDAFDRLKVSANNAFEDIASGFAKAFTKTFLDKADLSNVGITRVRDSIKDTAAEINSLNARIDEIKADKLGSKSVQAAAEVMQLTDRIKELKREKDRLLIESSGRVDPFGGFGNTIDQLNQQSKNEPDKIKRDPLQEKLFREQQLKRLNDLQAYVSQQDKIVLDAEIKRIETLNNLDQKLIAQKALNEQQSIILEQQKNTALAAIDTQFSNDKGFTEQQREQARLATLASFQAQEQQQAIDHANKLKAIEDNKNFSIQSGFTTFSEGFSVAAQDFRNNATASFKEVGKQAFNSLGRGVGQAFAAFGQALANGEDAGQAFLQSILGTFADLAINVGTMFILEGAARTWAGYPGGPGMIAAGSALAIFGGVLKGISGGKSKNSAGADTGGGIAASPSTSTELTPTQNLQRTEPQTAVQVNIQGDVLDSDESGSRIVNLLNSAFDKKGVVVTSGVFA